MDWRKRVVIFILIAIFIVIFISTSIIEKTLKSINKQNDRIIELLVEIKEQKRN
ncbi:hypothetical protein [Lederbergia graminis]|uniref:hypothetical protein n=1 Tax=Lederbergia graminis TaxID=735518 RepID=UPI0036D2BD74